MKHEKFLSVFTPFGIFGSALAGMIMIIVGAENGIPVLMAVGGGVIVFGIAVVAIVTAVLRRGAPSLETRLGLDRYVDAVTDIADDDDDDGEVPSARYEAILSTRLHTRTVTDIFDREDALNALLERSEMNGLMQHYEEEADMLWDDYEGEDSSATVDKLYELIDKYYGMYKQALPYFDKSKEAPAPESAAEEKKEEVKLYAADHEEAEQEEEEEQKEEVELHAYDHEVAEREAAPTVPPEPTIKPTPPASRSGAAVGYKPMKKK